MGVLYTLDHVRNAKTQATCHMLHKSHYAIYVSFTRIQQNMNSDPTECTAYEAPCWLSKLQLHTSTPSSNVNTWLSPTRVLHSPCWISPFNCANELQCSRNMICEPTTNQPPLQLSLAVQAPGDSDHRHVSMVCICVCPILAFPTV